MRLTDKRRKEVEDFCLDVVIERIENGGIMGKVLLNKIRSVSNDTPTGVTYDEIKALAAHKQGLHPFDDRASVATMLAEMQEELQN